MTSQPDNSPATGSLRRTVLLGLFTGTGVGVGYLLSGVPNVELMTFIAAMAGGVLGRALGFCCGALSALIYSLGNPFGAAVPQLLAAQVLALGCAALLGWWLTPAVLRAVNRGRSRRASALAMAGGLGATLFYDVLTNLALVPVLGLDPRVVLAGALPFALVHMTSNAVFFALLWPPCLVRFRPLARAQLRGSGGSSSALVFALVLTVSGSTFAQQVPAAELARIDSTLASPAGLSAAASASPQTRPIWDPFAANLVDLLERDFAFLPVADGGFGARLALVHEGSASGTPLFTREGIPLGTGHRWTDDPWTVPLTGLDLAGWQYGLDGFGGTDGVVSLVAADPRPDQTITETRFFKGPHASYLRSLAFRTPRAPWRLRFDFEESIDDEGYDLAVAGDARYQGRLKAGQAKFRCGRAALVRHLAGGGGLTLEVQTARKHKKSIPAAGVDHEEYWGDHAAMSWRAMNSLGHWRAALFWSGGDVERDHARKLESGREGFLLELWAPDKPARRLRMAASSWRVDDTGVKDAWAGADTGAVHADGQDVSVEAGAPWRWGEVAGEVKLAGWWDAYGGWRLGGLWRLRPARARPWWELSLQSGGRGPRSDELLTVDRVFGPGMAVVQAPNRDLSRERLWRGEGRLRARWAGTDLALVGSVRELNGGIVWTQLDGDGSTGRWENAAELSSRTLTCQVTREGRFAGWMRLRAEASWRGTTVHAGTSPALPPRYSAGLLWLWENRLFHDDGILEIGYRLSIRDSMPDPWLPAQLFIVPAFTRHDLLLGFRLLGADLSLALRNLTDERFRLSAGALSDGREMRLRLHWTFSQ